MYELKMKSEEQSSVTYRCIFPDVFNVDVNKWLIYVGVYYLTCISLYDTKDSLFSRNLITSAREWLKIVNKMNCLE